MFVHPVRAHMAAARPLAAAARPLAFRSIATGAVRATSLTRSSWWARPVARATALGAAFGISLAVGASPAMAFSKPNNKERTYIMIKPDGVQRGLIGDIVKRFEQRGFKLVALKMVTPSVSHLKEHYADLAKKPFFPSLIEYMASGPVVCMVWEGSHAVKIGRVLLGETNPMDSTPGSIRGDFCIEVGRNICHGSDAVDSAEHEIKLWFPEGVNQYDSCQAAWIFE